MQILSLIDLTFTVAVLVASCMVIAGRLRPRWGGLIFLIVFGTWAIANLIAGKHPLLRTWEALLALGGLFDMIKDRDKHDNNIDPRIL